MTDGNKIFVDASALIALFVKNDPHHQKAVHFIGGLHEKMVMKTTPPVYFEAMTVIAQKAGLSAAKLFRDHYHDISFQTYEIDKQCVLDAEKILFGQKSKNLPFFDCLYMSIMRKNNIKEIFTYDRHFKRLGFTLVG